jgi:hypothetical protein
VAILLTGELLIDPLTSLVIVAVIAFGTWGLLRDSVKLALLAVPDSIDEPAVRAYLAGLTGVSRGARPAHLADEHHRDRAYRAPGYARRAIPATRSCTNRPRARTSLPHRARDRSGRDRRRRRLRRLRLILGEN